MRLNNKNGVNLLYAETENNDNKCKIIKKNKHIPVLCKQP